MTPAFSVVIPLYNEEELIPHLRDRLEKALSREESFEVVLVDDGSTDETWGAITRWSKETARVRGIRLSRNFGHSAACTAGIDAARGGAVVLMDGDLQDPPELIPQLLEAWRGGAPVVHAHRRARLEPFPRRQLIQLFHRVFALLTDVKVPLDAGIFSLMDRRVIDPLRGMRERSRFLPGLRSYVGFGSVSISYDRPDRLQGQPKQTYSRLLKYALDATFSFSRKPLQASTLLGLIVASLSALYAAGLLSCRILGINVVPGFTTIAAGMFFLGGVQLISLGILGEYVARIYDEVKQRPIYIVQEESIRSGS